MKRIFTVLLISLFLMASVSFIAAAEESQTIDIPVRIVWSDAANAPSDVTVNLVKDGAVVASEKLNGANSWSATFRDVDANGNYNVAESGLDDYSVSINGNAASGFVITNTLKQAKLSATQDVQQNLSDDDSVKVNSTGATNVSSENNTANSTNQTNATNKTVPVNNNTNKTTNTAPQKVQKIINKHADVHKNKNKVSKHNLKNTGLPVVALILVVIGVAFVPFVRRK